jgi:ATP-dependent Clp protease ATP-binding subunit ClpC
MPMLSMTASSVLSGRAPSRPDSGEVTEAIVGEVLADKLGIAFEVVAAYLGKGLSPQLAGLEHSICERLVGQDQATQKVCQRLLVAQTGVGERRGPLAVFLFLGPSGVGKTYLAQLLAEKLRGSAGDLLRLDMSEFKEEHSVAKLVGSPPGYVGHEEEGQLTGRLRTRPYSVVLLDEVEKGHPRVLDLFLQVFDEGRITDSKGRVVDARNGIFIMTSNIPVTGDRTPGFIPTTGRGAGNPVLSQLERFFRKELLNRIDEIIAFSPLSEEDMDAIVHLQFADITRRAKEKYDLTLELSDDASVLLVEEAWSAGQGARGLDRVLDNRVVLPLTQRLLAQDLKPHERLVYLAINGQLELRARGT